MSQTTKTVRRAKAAHGRSAVSNRTRFFTEPTDERTIYARRYGSLVFDIAADAGGIEVLSELRLALVRRAASIIIEIERLESHLAKGEEINVDLLGRLTGHLRRLSETLGLDRATRDVTPTLADIVARHQETGPQKPARALKPSEGSILRARAVAPLHGLPDPVTEAAE